MSADNHLLSGGGDKHIVARLDVRQVRVGHRRRVINHTAIQIHHHGLGGGVDHIHTDGGTDGHTTVDPGARQADIDLQKVTVGGQGNIVPGRQTGRLIHQGFGGGADDIHRNAAGNADFAAIGTHFVQVNRQIPCVT
ncbi:hypothetical protein GCM10027217_25720 [Pseudomaricurvus hydrocarbonicus]